LPEKQILDRKTIKEICESGRSRIPVYKETDDMGEEIVAVLYMKDLIGIELKGKKVGDLARKDVIFVDSDKPLDDLLDAFKKTRHHLFIVLNEYGDMSGIVTIEDVLEEIIGEEIVDEFDKYENPQEEAKKKMKRKKLKRI
jgi:CBS domain containing-hemolysin-like protein